MTFSSLHRESARCRSSRNWFAAVVAVMAFSASPAVSAAPPIEFELIMEGGFPLGGSQQWLELLSRLNQTSIRIRQAQAGDRAVIENRGNDDRPIYHVIGILTSSNRLRLPGGEYSLSDRARLGDWIKKLETDGIPDPTKKTGAFGLTDQQLVDFHEKLAAPIPGQTKGRRAGDVARDIVQALGIEYAVSESARKAFNSSEIIGDDLSKLSSGTALAAAARPSGLVFRPEKVSGGNVRLLICDVAEANESWPVGWPPQQTPGKVAPKLFEYLKVTINDRPLPEAMDAIQQRLQIPFLLDHNSLARQRIDPASVQVSYTKERAMYKKILDHLLFQARLTSELRVDEAGHPFLWITPR